MLLIHFQHDAHQTFTDLIKGLQSLSGRFALETGRDLLCGMDADIRFQQDDHDFL